MDSSFAADAALTDDADSTLVEAASNEYLGRWNHLVSTTNWEKGCIICEWREALLAAGASANACTDDAWSRRVGNLTPQHAGRLRRVYQQFGQVREEYPRLFWSHFQVALDWSDAEMWLEGAVQNDWSVAQMRDERCRTLGELPATGCLEEAADELDDDSISTEVGPAQAVSSTFSEVHDAADAEREPSDFGPGDDGEDSSGSGADACFDAGDSLAEGSSAEPPRPFEGLPTLPPDLSEAFEAFKLSILHHRRAGWAEISCDDVLAVLDALRQFALAPAVL